MCSGKKAILTVYEDGVEREAVELYPLQTIEEMHSKMVELGFKKKDLVTKLRQSLVREDSAVSVTKEEAIAMLQGDNENIILYGAFFGVFGLLVAAYKYSNRRKMRSS